MFCKSLSKSDLRREFVKGEEFEFDNYPNDFRKKGEESINSL